MTTVVYLVSDQLLPAVLPVMRLKPKRLVLLYSHDRYIENVRRIQRYCRTKGIVDEIIHGKVDAFDPQETFDKICSLSLEYPNIIVNATGGTKLMAFGGYQAAREKGLACLYVDTESDLYRVINGELDEINGLRISRANLLVQDFFDLYGGIIVERSTNDFAKSHLAPFWQLVAENWGQWENTFHTFHKMFSDRKRSRKPECEAGTDQWGYAQSPSENLQTQNMELELTMEDSNRSLLIDHLQLMRNFGILQAMERMDDQEDRIKVHFANKEGVQLMKIQGRWLEGLVFQRLTDLVDRASNGDSIFPSDLITDVQAGVIFKWDGRNEHSARNEIDVMAVVGSRLIAISCKTGKVKDDDLFEMESILRFGGQFARKTLVSARPVESHIRDRARRLGTQIITVRELAEGGGEVLMKFRP